MPAPAHFTVSTRSDFEPPAPSLRASTCLPWRLSGQRLASPAQRPSGSGSAVHPEPRRRVHPEPRRRVHPEPRRRVHPEPGRRALGRRARSLSPRIVPNHPNAAGFNLRCLQPSSSPTTPRPPAPPLPFPESSLSQAEILRRAVPPEPGRRVHPEPRRRATGRRARSLSPRIAPNHPNAAGFNLRCLQPSSSPTTPRPPGPLTASSNSQTGHP